MSRFVAALLIARGPVTVVMVDPHVKGAEHLGAVRPSALLAQAVTGPRRERAGIEAVKRAGAEAWRIHQERQGDT